MVRLEEKNCVVVDMDPVIMIVVTKRQKDKKRQQQKTFKKSIKKN